MNLEAFPLGGQPVGVARDRISRWATAAGVRPDGSWPDRPLVFESGDRTWLVRGETVGLTFDLEATTSRAYEVGRGGGFWRTLARLVVVSAAGHALTPVVRFDQSGLDRTLTQVSLDIDRVPANIAPDPDSGEIDLGRPGRLLDITAARELVERAVAATPSGAPVLLTLPVSTLEPRGDAARLAALDLDCLARFETWFDPAEAGRSWNIALAAGLINGSVVEPGAELSFNQVVGPRAIEAGFREAPELVERELVPGIGGGVCQVATTVFNAALLADLDLVERYHHSRPLTYVNLGRDATVAYPQLDLVIRNPRPFPVVFTLRAQAGRLEAIVWGRRTFDATVRLATEELNLHPAEWEVISAPELPPGERRVERPAFDGREVRLWREVFSDGRQVRRELVFTDYYDPYPGQVRVGPPVSISGPWAETSGRDPVESRTGESAPPGPR